MEKAEESAERAKRLRTVARGYQSLKRERAAKVYEAAAEVLERVEKKREGTGSNKQRT